MWMKRRGRRPRATGGPDRFAALADPTRRHLLAELANGDRTVSELSAGLAISQPAVSQHLKVLREAGLVLYSSAGRSHLYRLCTGGIAEQCEWLLELKARWHAGAGRLGDEAGNQRAASLLAARDRADGAAAGQASPDVPAGDAVCAE
jgi:DNA-binding transcriptional ArsR family regulator